MGICEHFAAKEINPVSWTGFISSATGSGHVITCTARRWVVSGQLYCFQLPPAKGRREACKPFTDPTSRITNVRIKRAAAHRSKIFSASFPPCLRQAGLTYRKYACAVLPSAGRKILPKEGEGGAFPPCLRQGGLTYRKYACAVLPSAGRKILPKEGERVLFRTACVKGGVPRLRARVTFGRSPKSDQKGCLKPKVSRLPARYAACVSLILYRTVTGI